MATYFSDNYVTFDATTPVAISALPTIAQINDSSKAGRLRYKRVQTKFQVGLNPAASDQVRLATFRSTDRLIEIHTAMTATWGAAATADLGAYYTGNANDGAVIDQDRFGSDIDLNAGGITTRAEVLNEGGTGDAYEDYLRGAPLWEACAIASDPGGFIDIALTFVNHAEVTGGAVRTLTTEFYYHSGD